MSNNVINLKSWHGTGITICGFIQWLWPFIATFNNISVISALYSEKTIDLPQGSNKYYTQLCIECNYQWVGIELTIVACRKSLTAFNTWLCIVCTSPWVKIELTIVACHNSLTTFNTWLSIEYTSPWCGNRSHNLSLSQITDNL